MEIEGSLCEGGDRECASVSCRRSNRRWVRRRISGLGQDVNQQGDASTGGQPWFQIKGLYTKNIEAAYATLANQVMELANQKEAPTVQGPSAE